MKSHVHMYMYPCLIHVHILTVMPYTMYIHVHLLCNIDMYTLTSLTELKNADFNTSLRTSICFFGRELSSSDGAG